MSEYVMKPISDDTPRDRPLILGYQDYATMWVGRWSADAGEFMPRCAPGNAHAETTHERADSWCELPKWSTDHV